MKIDIHILCIGQVLEKSTFYIAIHWMFLAGTRSLLHNARWISASRPTSLAEKNLNSRAD